MCTEDAAPHHNDFASADRRDGKAAVTASRRSANFNTRVNPVGITVTRHAKSFCRNAYAFSSGVHNRLGSNPITLDWIACLLACFVFLRLPVGRLRARSVAGQLTF